MITCLCSEWDRHQIEAATGRLGHGWTASGAYNGGPQYVIAVGGGLGSAGNGGTITRPRTLRWHDPPDCQAVGRGVPETRSRAGHYHRTAG
jgi:hypothetical protein